MGERNHPVGPLGLGGRAAGAAVEVGSKEQPPACEGREARSQQVPLQSDWSPAAISNVVPVPLPTPSPHQSIRPHLISPTAQAEGFQSLPRPPRSTHSPTSTDPRSAAILTKKENIEQGYHDFCLNFAMVSMMLLQKEPSMEVVLMKALRANLRELRNRLLKEMEDFIQEYDVLHPSC